MTVPLTGLVGFSPGQSDDFTTIRTVLALAAAFRPTTFLTSSTGKTPVDYLASRGIASGRIRTVSYGKERPVAVCNDISCWSQNRRAVTVLDRGAGS